MKIRILLLMVAAGLVAFGVWSIFRRGERGTASGRAPVTRTAPAPVPIPDGKTLDFSSGKPVVKDSAADRAALAKGVAEMDSAAAAVTFSPKPATATPTSTTATTTKTEQK